MSLSVNSKNWKPSTKEGERSIIILSFSSVLQLSVLSMLTLGLEDVHLSVGKQPAPIVQGAIIGGQRQNVCNHFRCAGSSTVPESE